MDDLKAFVRAGNQGSIMDQNKTTDDEVLAPPTPIPFQVEHDIDFSDVDPNQERTDPNYTPPNMDREEWDYKTPITGEMVRRI